MKCLIKFRKPWGLWKHMLIANLREEKILHHLKKCQASKIIFDFKNCRYFTVAGYIKPGGRGKGWWASYFSLSLVLNSQAGR